MDNWNRTTREVDKGRETREIPPHRTHPRVLVISGPQSGRVFALEAESTIGRDPAATVSLVADDVSRRHARIRQETCGYVLDDLGSRNGTSVDGVPAKRHVLKVGDRVKVGTSNVLLFTHRDDCEAQWLHSQKMEAVGRLAGGVAHDFNNLLSVSLSNIGYLRGLCDEGQVQADELRACLDDMEAASQRAAELTRQLLHFSRQARMEQTSVDMSALAHEVEELIRRAITEKIVIRSSVAPGITAIGDRTQLYQMLVNLCLNARDAMTPSGGELTLTLTAVDLDDPAATFPVTLPTGGHLLLTVCDTGVGMDDATQAQIFEPFFTTKGLGKGSGLGLAVAHGIVKTHGGEIVVDSQPSRGTTFRVYLPMQARGDAPEERQTRQTAVALVSELRGCG
jgi:signal transduction histidine kinase